MLVPFPFTDLSGAKKRPALVVSKTSFNQGSRDIICCLVTSKAEPEAGCPPLGQKDLKSGVLPFDSKIKPHRLFTMEKTLVLKKLGELGAAKAAETKRELLKLFE